MAEGRAAPSPADAALVAAVAAGSEDALAALYDRHAAAIHATAFRLTGDRQVAEDVVQEVFLTLWNRAERFDPAAGSLTAWLGTMARNRAIDRLRAAGRRPQLVALGRDDDEGSADEALERAAQGERAGRGFDADDPVAAIEAGETRSAINAALATMPDARARGDPAGLPRRPDPERDRRAPGMAARHREDPHATGAGPAARCAGGRLRPAARAGAAHVAGPARAGSGEPGQGGEA